MKLTPSQVQRFWREWPKACEANGWTRAAGLTAAQIDTKRKEFLARCGFTSLTLVDRVDGFTKVLKELQVLQGVNLAAAREADDPAINRGRVTLHKLGSEIIPCLELYVEDVPAYITKIIQDKSRWWKLDRPARPMRLTDLDTAPIPTVDRTTGEPKLMPSQLDQILYTLSSRLNDLRNQAGDSIHDMKLRARVPCACKTCRASPLVAPLAATPAESSLQNRPF